jgi:hypothetical protein
VSEDAPAKGRIAAWEDRHRTAVTRGSLVGLLLIAVVLFLVLRGGSNRQTCSLFHRSLPRMYLVIRAPGSSREARQVCTQLAATLSTAGEGRFSTSAGSDDYSDEAQACAFHRPSVDIAIYARRRAAPHVRKLCRFYKSGRSGPLT